MRTIYTLIAAALVLATSSCGASRALYIRTPDKVNAPGLTKKDDLKVDVSVSLQNKGAGGSPVSVSADAAYALGKNFGLLASYRGVNKYNVGHEWNHWRYRSSGDSVEIQDFVLRGGRFEGGIGWFKQMEKDFGIEGYFGLGFGSIKNTSSSSTPGPYKVAYSSFFAQYGVFYFYKYFSIGTGIRLLRISNYKFDYKNSPYISRTIDQYDAESGFTYFTPFFQLRGGSETVKLNVQCGYELRLSNLLDNVDYRPGAGYLSVGLTFQPSRKWFKNAPGKRQNLDVSRQATGNIL